MVKTTDMTDREDYVRGYPLDELKEGEIIRVSPVTGEEYRVTKWIERGDDRVIALEKELIDDD